MLQVDLSDDEIEAGLAEAGVLELVDGYLHRRWRHDAKHVPRRR